MTYRPFSVLAWSVWGRVDGSGCFCTPLNRRPLEFPLPLQEYPQNQPEHPSDGLQTASRPIRMFTRSQDFPLFERILNPFCLNIEMAL